MNSRVKEDVQKIFEFWCEVTKTENSKQTGIIIESFPENYRDEQIITKIPDFAYPCEFENERVQTYSFVLTSDDSKWRFGFCRHDPKTQTAMIIITYLPWHDTFLRFLNVLAELRRTKNGEFESFLSETYNKGVPEAGASLTLFFNGGNFTFQRPSQFKLPSIPENHNLNLYYNFVEPKSMILIFAAMLSERRIIFTSTNLEKLSSCIQASNAFLYPMVWQHIFIPVLPAKLKDILSAPMPFLIGVPEPVLKTMTSEELGEVVIYNCDNKQFDSPFDDLKQMPPEIVSQMKKQLNNTNEHIGDRISKIFLNALVQLIGGYRDAVRFTEKKITFDKNTFVESRPPHLRDFLSRMMELQIFQQFIDERLFMLNQGLGFSDEFELETLRYAEKMGKRGRNYKEFLRNVKDKTNPAVKSAVKSVKESSKGVKTAYKDLKSKLRDSTPPKSHFHVSNSFSGAPTTSVHRSAPNSPVFSKRQINSEFTNGINSSIRSQIITSSTSNSQIQQHNNYTNCSSSLTASNHSNFINNNHLSPAISPASSLCSSDMNLTQEFQNHPLFMSPTVDRTLKPSNSLDYQRMVRYGGPQLNAPSALSQQKMLSIQQNKSLLTNSPSPPPPPLPKNPPPENISIGNLCIIDLDDNTRVTKSIFDVPPDMPSPPVPPRRTNAKAKLTDSLDNNLLIVFENSINGDTDKNTVLKTHKICGSSYRNNVPVPVPRQKLKELTTIMVKQKLNMTKLDGSDLITLDDSNNSSFDIEDFDPLNMNAKPIPTSLLKSNSSTPNANNFLTTTSNSINNSSGIGSTISSNNDSGETMSTLSTKSMYLPSTSNGCTIPAVHNPIYPYFTPQHHRHNHSISVHQQQQQQQQSNQTNKDDDFELLKKYGLDQFSLKTINNLNSSNKISKKDKLYDKNSVKPNTWTTFE